MESLLSRPTVIGFEVAGGVFSVAMLLRKKQAKEAFARQIDMAGYVLRGISMLLFIIVGFRGQA